RRPRALDGVGVFGCSAVSSQNVRLAGVVSETEPGRHPSEWPPLPLDEWLPTYETLRRWTQIVGKTRLALAPFENHWWHCTLFVTPRGLTTSAMPYNAALVEIEFDFLDHVLLARHSR